MSLSTLQPLIYPHTMASPSRRASVPAIGSTNPVFGSTATAALNDKKDFSKTPDWANQIIFDPLVNVARFLYLRPRLVGTLQDALSWFVPGTLEANKTKYFKPYETVEFRTVDDFRLKGYWMPAVKSTINQDTNPDFKIAKSNKTVVLGHGYTSNWRGVIGVADYLRKQGVNVFMFDFRAHGDSEGTITSFGYHEGKDVAAAIRYVKERFDKQSKTLYYMGHSMGAASLMLTPKSLKPYPEELKFVTKSLDGIILDSPYDHLQDAMVNNVMEVLNTQPVNRFIQWLWPGAALRRFSDRLCQRIKAEGGKQLSLGKVPLNEMDTGEVMKEHALGQDKPILFIHGTEDTIAPYKMALNNFNSIKAHNPKSYLFTMDGLEHFNRRWRPFINGKRYCTALRGGPHYLNTLNHFLAGEYGDTLAKISSDTP